MHGTIGVVFHSGPRARKSLRQDSRALGLLFHHAELQAKAHRSFTKCGLVPIRGASMYFICRKGSAGGRLYLTLIRPTNITLDLDYSKGSVKKTPGRLRLTF